MAKISIKGYKKGSPDNNQPSLIIPSGRISMADVPHPVAAVDNLGNKKIMFSGGEYQFPGDMVMEIPLKGQGGPSPAKAHEMLKDGTANGKPLTDKQKRYFGMIYGNSKKQQGGLAAANAEAKRFALSRGLVNPESTFVDSIPQYVDERGRPVTSVQPSFPSKLLNSFIPKEVTSLEWDSDKNLPYYLDPNSGDIMYTKPENFYLPRFKKPTSEQETAIAMRGSKKEGGYKKGGLTRKQDYGSKKKPYPSVKGGDFAGPHRSYPIPTHADAVDALQLAHLHGAHGVIKKVLSKYPDLKKQMGGEAGKHGPFNMLESLDMFNFGLTKLAENMQNREQQRYQDQMQLLQNQPVVLDLTNEQQYGNPTAYQIGGVVPPDLSYISPTFDMPTIPSAAISSMGSGATSTGSAIQPNIQMSPEIGDYANKANKYLSTKFPKSNISGEMLAQGAAQAYQRFGKIVPVELALAQLQIEGYLAKGNKNKPQRTKNPFNVGNTDSGDTVSYNNVQDGINKYYSLLAGNYLKKRSPQELLQNFVNSSGNRYSTAPDYEEQLGSIMSNMKLKKGGWIKGAINPSHKGFCSPMTKKTCTPKRKALARRFKSGDLHKGYKLGGEYTLNKKQIEDLKNQGYEIQLID